MNPLTLDIRSLLAGEIAANLAEIARWEWSDEVQDAAQRARRLADGIYEGQGPDDSIEIIHGLSEAINFRLSRIPDVFPSSPAEWLASLGSVNGGGAVIPEGASKWRDNAHRAFYALRARSLPRRTGTGRMSPGRPGRHQPRSRLLSVDPSTGNPINVGSVGPEVDRVAGRVE